MFRIHKLILFLALCNSNLFALSSDQEQKIHIVSDFSLYDYKTGVKTYEGHVQIDQGTTHLTADKVVTKTNDKHHMEEAIAYGTEKPAEYTTSPKEGDPLLRAKAKIIKFNPISMIITLEGDVVVIQGENSFQGPLIVYNMKEQTVTAPASKSGRTTLVIDPKQLTL